MSEPLDTSALAPSDAQRTTFAQRNPQKDIISVRPRQKASTTADAKLCQHTAALARQALVEDLEAFVSERENLLDELAMKHGVSGESIRQNVSTASAYRNQRVPNLANAILSDKMQKMNEG